MGCCLRCWQVLHLGRFTVKHPTLHNLGFGNSVFSARSFFQVGDVQPANENRYGFRFTAPLWTGARISLNGTQQKIRGQVNGNVLVPLPEERTPLTNDPELRRIVQGLIDSFPDEVPNRTDIDQRALNTNAPQRIDTDTAGIRLDQGVLRPFKNRPRRQRGSAPTLSTLQVARIGQPSLAASTSRTSEALPPPNPLQKC